jgi:hypothetical protein
MFRPLSAQRGSDSAGLCGDHPSATAFGDAAMFDVIVGRRARHSHPLVGSAAW